MVGLGPAQFKKNSFSKIVIVFCVFFTKFCLVFGWYFYTKKNTNPILKYLVFVKTSKIQKTNLKKEEEKKKKHKKIGEETVRTVIVGTSTVASSCVLPPPPPLPAP
jgi:uncharacterized ion transporter superfamily protein YfcC